MLIDFGSRTVQTKLCLYGPAMSGKTTALKGLYAHLNGSAPLVSIETSHSKNSRTLFYDLGTLELKFGIWKLKLNFWTATGQDFYCATRTTVLQGADGLIFVADSQKLLLDENIKIRRLTPEDMEYVQRADYYGGLTLLHKFIESNAIIEVNLVPNISKENNINTNEKYFYFKGLMERELMIELDYISLALKLFRLGSVFVHKVERTSDSLIQKGKTIAGDFLKIKQQIKYEIKERDIPKINNILVLMGGKDHLFDLNKKLNPFIIAVERFNNAFLNAENSESSIMFMISSLEALFLKGSELSELSRRLYQRISILLKQFGFNPLLISKILKDAYKIRSKYSHGSKMDFDKENIKEVNEFKIKVMECARISLLIYLQLVGNIKKENFLTLIDKSLLDDATYSKLNKFIKDNCKVEIPIPPCLI